MASIFISYRREDAAGHAGRLSDRLTARFGSDGVFMDVQDIRPGENFAQSIEATLARCDCILAVVGPRWLELLDGRVQAGEDFVRHEIAAALASQATVIPVLVGGAKMPATDRLPPDLAALGRRQAVQVRDERFDDDVARLLEFLDTSLPVPDIDGAWVAEMAKPGQRPYRIRLRINRLGDQVVGMVQYPTGEGSILDGRISGERLTFHTSHVPQFGSSPAAIRFLAEVAEDGLRLQAIDDSGVATGVAKRPAPR